MIKRMVLLAAVLGLVLFSGESVIAAGRPVKAKPKVEVVFCLDTTGSMGGLIKGAKQKIWSIANQIVKGKPTPDLQIGLVAYRDKGDEYVTKVYSLDSDLDTVFENLMSFEALGGGDGPEHVNKALHDSVHEISWSKDKRTLKLIFLVGDAPPHMDYKDSYDYRRICKEAVKKDIIINTIQCGDYKEAEKYWRDIAKRSEGKYARVQQSGGMQVVETPMDDELSKLNLLLEGTVVAYGAAEVRAKSAGKMSSLKAMAPSVAAERAAYKTSGASMSAYDLVDAIGSGKVKLSDIKDKELPEEMRKMSLAQRRKYLAKKENERQALKAKIEKISKKRSAYIAKKLKENPKTDSFDSVVQGIIKKQAAKKGIGY
jgi:hypothetical protein